MLNTKIEWATDTVNFWWGCSKVSPACEHCYAEAQDTRFYSFRFPGGRIEGDCVVSNGPHWGPHAERFLRVDKAVGEIKKIQRRALKTGERHRVFVNSMSDFFEDRRDLDAARLSALYAMHLAPQLTFMLLTKRPEKILNLLRRAEEDAYGSGLSDWLRDWLHGTPPTNVWVGSTAENQEWADRRIPALLQVPAAIRFLSVEPMLGPVDLEFWPVQVDHPDNEGYGLPAIKALDWIICGGESGPRARPMHPAWATALCDQCAGAGVPFFFKQWGSMEPLGTVDGRQILPFGNYCLPGGPGVVLGGFGFKRRVGKGHRLLDGHEYNQFPVVP